MDSKIFIGLMSGTSVDGLDICAAMFCGSKFEIVATKSCEYPSDLHQKLLLSHTLSAIDLAQLHVNFGIFCGRQVKQFITENKLSVAYVASHGQTVFHTPHTGLTLQIGSGAHIAAESGISTICDFRSLDVAMGGQGAPLVPIGDELLFSEYDYCLNIGGFANVSTNENGARIAWDVCPANIVLNAFALKHGKSFDEGGNFGRQGSVNADLLTKLNNLPYYSQPSPKSLGREWVEQFVNPLFQSVNCSEADKLRTFYEHCAEQIGKTLKGRSRTLCTGGGVKNSFLMERILAFAESELVIPNEQLIDYKEALIFAYLGYLRVCEQPNCLSSVTGAKRNVCGGIVWLV